MPTALADALASTCAAAEEHATAADEQAAFPVAALNAMRDTGLLGLLVPRAFGGSGGSLGDLVDTTVELGRADLSVALVFAMHCQQVATIDRHGSDRLLAHVLPLVAEGGMYLASVTTEIGSGGHLLESRSPVDHDGALLHIDRHAPIVTGGRHADGFLITVQTPGAATPSQVDLVFAARGQLDVEVLGDWQPLGMRATESVPMRLRGDVPDWQVVGESGAFRTITATVFAPLAHVGWAAAWLGTATGALSGVVRRLRKGRAFGPSADLQSTRLADVRSRLEVVNALLRHTVRVLDTAPDLTAAPVQMLVNTLKVRASEECHRAVDELVELVGMNDGYLTGSSLHLERALRDLRSASLNYRNDRLRLVNGAIALMDTQVRLV